MAEIYADEGISGTSLKHRDAFVKMITDCEAGKIDLIITKSVSRFARNVLDCLNYVRKLQSMNPPIGIFFEAENIYTLGTNSELMLSIISTLAQEESHTKSLIMNASIEMRFGNGIFLTPTLLGYDHDAEGNLVINEEEAKTVRLIFFTFLYGYSTTKIAELLVKLGRPTKPGNYKWSSSTVLYILQNERYCGDILARKTYTPNYLDHKSVKNKQKKQKYFLPDHHEGIIQRDDFTAVQSLIKNVKYGYSGLLPQLKVIKSGVLKGFVSINPRWKGFSAANYYEASSSVFESEGSLQAAKYSVQAGEFDFTGYEIIRSQYFDYAKKVSATFSTNNIKFGIECFRKLGCFHIEMLVNPFLKLFIVRPSNTDNKNTVTWAKNEQGKTVSRSVAGTAFLPNLYELFEWNKTFKYRITGTKYQRKDEKLLVFNIEDIEILIPNSTICEHDKKPINELLNAFGDDTKPFGNRCNIVAFPSDWNNSFGTNYYQHKMSDGKKFLSPHYEWNSLQEAVDYSVPVLNLTSLDELNSKIQQLITTMKQEANNE